MPTNKELDERIERLFGKPKPVTPATENVVIDATNKGFFLRRLSVGRIGPKFSDSPIVEVA